MKKNIVTFLVIIGLIFLIVGTDFNTITYNIKQIPFKTFAFSLVLQMITILSIGLQWSQILSSIGLKRKYFNVLKVNLKGNIFDAITPGSKVGGEVVRVLEIKDSLKIDLDDAIVVLGLQKSFSLLSFISLGVVSLIYLRVEYKNFISQGYFYLAIGLLSLGVVFILSFLIVPGKIRSILIKRNTNKTGDILKFLNTYIKNVEKLKRSKVRLILNLFLALFIWILYSLKLILIVRVFNNEIGIFKLQAVTYISYLLGMIPLLPGSIGTFEAGMTSLLYLCGLSVKEGVVVSIIFRFVTFWFEFIISGLIVLLDKLYKKKVQGEKYA